MECPEDTLIHTESSVGCRAVLHQPPEPPGRPRLTWCGSHQLPGGHYRPAAPSWRCQWWPPGSGEHGGAGEQAPLAALGRPCNTPLTTLWLVSWSEGGEGPCGLLTRRGGMIPRYGYHDASRKTHMQPSHTMGVTAKLPGPHSSSPTKLTSGLSCYLLQEALFHSLSESFLPVIPPLGPSLLHGTAHKCSFFHDFFMCIFLLFHWSLCSRGTWPYLTPVSFCLESPDLGTVSGPESAPRKH